MQKWLIVWLSAAYCAACSSEQPGPGVQSSSRLRTEASFCDAWAKAACNDDVVGQCDSTEDGCLTRQSAFCEDLVPFGYASPHARECIDAVESAYADGVLEAEEAAIVLHLGAPCDRLVSGGRLAGDACTMPTDCDRIHDYTCVIKTGEASGTCQVPEPAGGGDPCDEPQIVCDDGFFCDAASGACLRAKATGVACTSNGMCESAGVCDIPTGTETGTCRPKLDARAPCTADDECASGLCIASAMGQTCRTSVTLSLDTTLCNDL